MSQKCKCFNSRLFPHRAEKCMFASKSKGKKSAHASPDMQDESTPLPNPAAATLVPEPSALLDEPSPFPTVATTVRSLNEQACSRSEDILAGSLQELELTEHVAVAVAVQMDLDEKFSETTDAAKCDKESVDERLHQQRAEEAVCAAWTFVDESGEDGDKEELEEECASQLTDEDEADFEVGRDAVVGKEDLGGLMPEDADRPDRMEDNVQCAQGRKAAGMQRAHRKDTAHDASTGMAAKAARVAAGDKKCRCVASKLTPHRRKHCRLKAGLVIGAVAAVAIGTVAAVALLASADDTSDKAEDADAGKSKAQRVDSSKGKAAAQGKQQSIAKESKPQKQQCTQTAAQSAVNDEQARARQRAIATELAHALHSMAQQRALARKQKLELARLHKEAEEARLQVEIERDRAYLKALQEDKDEA
jgi:hypothetical protein